MAPGSFRTSDIEHVHRLGRKTDNIRPRAVIARFVSDKTRDNVLVQELYDFLRNKLQHKVSQQCLLNQDVLYDILKV